MRFWSVWEGVVFFIIWQFYFITPEICLIMTLKCKLMRVWYMFLTGTLPVRNMYQTCVNLPLKDVIWPILGVRRENRQNYEKHNPFSNLSKICHFKFQSCIKLVSKRYQTRLLGGLVMPLGRAFKTFYSLFPRVYNNLNPWTSSHILNQRIHLHRTTSTLYII